ncbi:MAG: hypothetical protein IKZ46_02390 [Victivallales bacterium]|nr:hypothetical protein [Victivallales bacterium]
MPRSLIVLLLMLALPSLHAMKHIAVINTVPHATPSKLTPDGAVAGNGDVALIWGGTPAKHVIYIGKSDFWEALPARAGKGKGGIRPFGTIEITVPEVNGKDWHIEQDMDIAQLRGTFGSLNIALTPLTTENTILLQLSGPKTSVASVTLRPSVAKRLTATTSNDDGMQSFTEVFDSPALEWPTCGAACLRKLSDSLYVIALATNHESADWKTIPTNRCRSLTADDCQSLLQRHADWWRDFWSKSAVLCPSKPEIELNWFAGQYLLACAARNPNFPPGLFGNFITAAEPGWGGDYHMNYNYQATFYAATSSNHPELLDGYHVPLEEFMPTGREFARDIAHCHGIYYPVSIAPKALRLEYNQWTEEEHGESFLGQKSDAAFGAVVMVMRWKGTMDQNYATQHLYPYLRELADFWKDYLVFEDGRFNDHRDAAHEVPFYIPDFRKKYPQAVEREKDMNPILSLGLLRMIFQTLIELADEYGLGKDQTGEWSHILNHLPPFPTFVREGKRIFRLTEKGHEWVGGNAVSLQHIYPAGQIRMDSPAELLEIARQSILETDRWMDGNGTSTVYPAAARVGIDPQLILDKLSEHAKRFQFPNMMFNHGGGGMENVAVYANTINEMLLQSNHGVMSIFPNWPKTQDIAFYNLRADGAYLVSAEQKDGIIRNVRIVCERTGCLKVRLPDGSLFTQNVQSGEQITIPDSRFAR